MNHQVGKRCFKALPSSGPSEIITHSMMRSPPTYWLSLVAVWRTLDFSVKDFKSLGINIILTTGSWTLWTTKIKLWPWSHDSSPASFKRPLKGRLLRLISINVTRISAVILAAAPAQSTNSQVVTGPSSDSIHPPSSLLSSSNSQFSFSFTILLSNPPFFTPSFQTWKHKSPLVSQSYSKFWYQKSSNANL